MWISVCFDRCSIGVGSIETFSTNQICFSIDQKSCKEIFLKLIFTCSNSLFQKFFNFFSLYKTRSRLQSNFLLFSTILFARFFSPMASKTFIPFILNLFSLFMHQIMHYLGNFEPMKFLGFFDELSLFFHNWSMDFCWGML